MLQDANGNVDAKKFQENIETITLKHTNLVDDLLKSKEDELKNI